MLCQDSKTSLEINNTVTKATAVRLQALCHIQLGETGSAGALPLRINKHHSLELQIKRKVKRQ